MPLRRSSSFLEQCTGRISESRKAWEAASRSPFGNEATSLRRHRVRERPAGPWATALAASLFSSSPRRTSSGVSKQFSQHASSPSPVTTRLVAARHAHSFPNSPDRGRPPSFLIKASEAMKDMCIAQRLVKAFFHITLSPPPQAPTRLTLGDQQPSMTPPELIAQDLSRLSSTLAMRRGTSYLITITSTSGHYTSLPTEIAAHLRPLRELAEVSPQPGQSLPLQAMAIH
ncbi:hypothetical protein K505DRAFT_342184 [Melanomma pulvis-pyrius CBS 109.77]|uniref:Uncharacterized protein n=1 Tax=Melanomma pulvis-pyrius CBS 109.77 TaxID=1314802 RepID=A0A6A6WX87_9PLEO|nr:hypothetical protein K505DRAFT_342184 [Melanomma pulvis-pyrius CBS 109.77]